MLLPARSDQHSYRDSSQLSKSEKEEPSDKGSILPEADAHLMLWAHDKERSPQTAGQTTRVRLSQAQWSVRLSQAQWSVRLSQAQWSYAPGHIGAQCSL